MTEFQLDLITVYRNVMREVEGGVANFEELFEVMERNGIEIDSDSHPIVPEED